MVRHSHCLCRPATRHRPPSPRLKRARPASRHSRPRSPLGPVSLDRTTFDWSSLRRSLYRSRLTAAVALEFTSSRSSRNAAKRTPRRHTRLCRTSSPGSWGHGQRSYHPHRHRHYRNILLCRCWAFRNRRRSLPVLRHLEGSRLTMRRPQGIGRPPNPLGEERGNAARLEPRRVHRAALFLICSFHSANNHIKSQT
jgi:hypothetical protein